MACNGSSRTPPEEIERSNTINQRSFISLYEDNVLTSTYSSTFSSKTSRRPIIISPIQSRARLLPYYNLWIMLSSTGYSWLMADIRAVIRATLSSLNDLRFFIGGRGALPCSNHAAPLLFQRPAKLVHSESNRRRFHNAGALRIIHAESGQNLNEVRR